MAKIVIKLKGGGKWVVEALDDIHSYELAPPSKVQNIRSHKKLSFTTRKLIDEPYSCDIGPSKITRVLNHNSGGINKRELTSNNCRNHLSKARKNNIGWHCLKVLEYFQRKIEIDEGFFFKMEEDENNQVGSLFWADNRSRGIYAAWRCSI